MNLFRKGTLPDCNHNILKLKKQIKSKQIKESVPLFLIEMKEEKEGIQELLAQINFLRAKVSSLENSRQFNVCGSVLISIYCDFNSVYIKN